MIRRAVLAGVLALIATLPVLAQQIPEKQADLFLDFARDVSGNDPDIMAQAQSLIATPPTTRETIGFYGLEKAPAPERSLRGIISVLEDEGYLLGVEDKYIYELPFVLDQLGWAEGQDDPDLDILTGLTAAYDAGRDPTPEDWQSFRSYFSVHTKAIEEAVARSDRRLMSLRIPLGDTMYVWAPAPDVAARWHDTALYVGVDTLGLSSVGLVQIRVSDPAWDIYWDFMTYAMDIPEPYWAYPAQE